MILHLVDDEKVIDRAVLFFNKALPCKNIFLCFCEKDNEGKYSPKYVNSRDCVSFFDLEKDTFKFDVNEIDQVIIHALYWPKVSFIIKYIPETIQVCWFVWGNDLYGHILYNMGYPLYPLCNSYISTKEWIFNRAKRLIGYESARSQYLANFVRKRISSIGCCDGDYKLLQRYLKIGNLKRVEYYYYPIEEVMGDLLGKSISVDADVIMCGNSAAESNNHEYLIRYLKNIGVSDSKIVMPLSYCGTYDYINRIVDLCVKIWGPDFQPILNFLPLNEYNALFLKTKTCVYASWRQMAVGNILVALYLGSKVYLSRHNPWLADAKNMGLKVFTLEGADKKTWKQQLSSEDKACNRRIIEQFFSSERLIKLIKEEFS